MRHKKTILIIDDEKDACRIFKKVMTEEGYRVLTATSGREGLAKIRKEPPSMVFLDIKMPEIDGIETLRRIRKIAKGLIVIMLTGHSDLKTAKETMRLGACDYITKPFDLMAIKASIRDALEEKGARVMAG
jgi:DNA-binding NtrC family response regulator